MIQNLLILYNPFYQENVIELHLAILKEKGKVAFGKIRPKSKDQEHKHPETLERIYQSTNSKDFLQLFLTDFASLFVAKVEAVREDLEGVSAPEYYFNKDRKFNSVEAWFIITDMRELERNDFTAVRDRYLPNFTTPDHNNHTFRIYGNDYDYPLAIEMKKEINYFEDPKKHYPNVFKSAEFLELKERLIELNFGATAYKLHHASLDNVIYAEMEYQKNKQDPLYDFGPIALRYSKILEQEAYALFKDLVRFLAQNNPKILEMRYFSHSKKENTPLGQILSDDYKDKPVLADYKNIIALPSLQQPLLDLLPSPVRVFLSKSLLEVIEIFRSVRNKSAHGNERTSLKEAQCLRNEILGITGTNILKEIANYKATLTPPKPKNSPKKVLENIGGIRVVGYK
ncbi:ATP-binding protein [Helicobacter sp. NHP19-012]|uniref:ATP-binding protein n=1 Tax=Helicobacter gastrofelis TaxID=2849642 RepID=A0ABM7SH25_9HELI|nr:HP0729 family protein [Helicobacter sp. NHP19-012]BCZ19154.1 ATP-binding protein [Helicobacter sp. NHP19-012]